MIATKIVMRSCENHSLKPWRCMFLSRNLWTTIGIVLCSDTDDDIARYSVMHGNEQLFASKYKLYLPTKEELKAEIETQKAMFYLQQQDNEDRNKNYTFNIEWVKKK